MSTKTFFESQEVLNMSSLGSTGRQILNVTLTGGATDDALTFAQPVTSMVIQNRSTVDVQLRTAAAAGQYYTLKAGTALGVDVFAGPTPFYVRGTAGNIVEVIGLF